MIACVVVFALYIEVLRKSTNESSHVVRSENGDTCTCCIIQDFIDESCGWSVGTCRTYALSVVSLALRYSGLSFSLDCEAQLFGRHISNLVL